ncbi:MAG: 4Fe-4S dicluster domain-containing protein [Phycisphaerales bacterium]|nr:MAG: 4Fe-4S dicluster domain-containing protein [Phycisphaerales bacterium]
MRFKGGYNVLFQGKPDGAVQTMPEPEKLYLPLRSERFHFSSLSVEEGQQVQAGDVLATDPDNFDIPLLAPRAGRVRLEQAENHIVLESIEGLPEHAELDGREILHAEQKAGTAAAKREALVRLGAWQFLYDAHTQALPDPTGTPQAVIVSTVSLEPFLVRGDVLLHRRLLNFTRGLEHLQSLLEYQPIYFAIPDIRSEFADLVRNHIRGYAWVKLLEIPLVYPYDDFAILARGLELSSGNGPVWAVRTEGVLAIDQALTLDRPCLTRTIAIGGTGVVSPSHIEVAPGYPLKAITDKYVFEPNPRIIDGGILTGKVFGDEALGIGTECRGITVLPELKEREFLGFARPGSDRGSFSACFLSSLTHRIRERLTTAMRGELRPCVSCNFCEEVCPAGISPHLIHKYLYRDLIEEAAQARVDLCVECGLCSYVCPSKIDLRAQFTEARELIEQDKREAREAKAREEAVEETSA